MPAEPILPRDHRLNSLESFVREQHDMLNEVSEQLGEFRQNTKEDVLQMGECFRSLLLDVASLKASLEPRLASLALLVEEQQDQIRQLRSASSSLTHEVTALRLDHRGLKNEHRALCDCLVGKRPLRPKELRARSRWHHGLGLLREVLDDRQVMLRTWRMAGNSVGRLLLASSSLHGLHSWLFALRAEGSLRPGGRAAAWGLGEAEVQRLLQAARDPSQPVWKRLAEHEPSERSLERWASSAIVGKAFGSFVIENTPGGCEEMNFAAVHKLLAELEISTEQLVGKFLYVRPLPGSSSSNHSLQPVADEILEKFASKRTEGGRKRLHFRDLHRLLEVIGVCLRKFENQFALITECEFINQHFGKYRVLGSIGGGCQGECFLAQEPKDGSKVAIKWPVEMGEVSTLRQLMQRPQPGLGLPRLLGTGEYQEKTYMVTPAFGSPLLKLFDHLEGCSASQRWRAMKVLGRLMVRRLQSLHTAGLVHCDISPENILLGPPPVSTYSAGARFAPFLVDFGHAQKFPGGPGLTPGEAGSLEWSSIRSAECRDPLPEDDLQALGWVLLHGVFGELPWFKMLCRAARHMKKSRFIRDQTVMHVRQAKIQLLKGGWQSFGLARAKVPEELDKFIRDCGAGGSTPELASPANDRVSGTQGGNRRRGLPDYAALVRTLGGDSDLGAEEQDLRLFSGQLIPFL